MYCPAMEVDIVVGEWAVLRLDFISSVTKTFKDSECVPELTVAE